MLPHLEVQVTGGRPQQEGAHAMNDLLGGAPERSKRSARAPPASSASMRANELYDADEVDLEEGGPPPPPPSEGEQSMKAFFKTVEELKENMAEIRGLQREVVDLNEKGKTLVKTKAVQKHQEEMQVGAGNLSGICMGVSTHPE